MSYYIPEYVFGLSSVYYYLPLREDIMILWEVGSNQTGEYDID